MKVVNKRSVHGLPHHVKSSSVFHSAAARPHKPALNHGTSHEPSQDLLFACISLCLLFFCALADLAFHL